MCLPHGLHSFLALAGFLPSCPSGTGDISSVKPPARPKPLPMLPLLILMASLIVGTGCCKTVTPQPKPPRPKLESLAPGPNGGICIGGSDTTELLNYLDRLERRP